MSPYHVMEYNWRRLVFFLTIYHLAKNVSMSDCRYLSEGSMRVSEKAGIIFIMHYFLQ